MAFSPLSFFNGDFLTLLNELFFLLDKLSVVFGVWFFGGKLSNRFRGVVPFFVLFFVRLFLGIVVYASGVIIGSAYFTSFPPVIADLAGTVVAFFVFYFVLFFLTWGVPSKFLSRREFNELVDRVERLESLVNRVFNNLVEEGVVPERFSLKDGEKVLSNVMQSKGFEEWSLVGSEVDGDFLVYHVKCRVRSFRVVLDSLTGGVVSFSLDRVGLKNFFLFVLDYFYSRKVPILGLFLGLLFVYAVVSSYTPISGERFNSLLSLEPEPVNSSVSDLPLSGFDLVSQSGFGGFNLSQG